MAILHDEPQDSLCVFVQVAGLLMKLSCTKKSIAMAHRCEHAAYAMKKTEITSVQHRRIKSANIYKKIVLLESVKVEKS